MEDLRSSNNGCVGKNGGKLTTTKKDLFEQWTEVKNNEDPEETHLPAVGVTVCTPILCLAPPMGYTNIYVYPVGSLSTLTFTGFLTASTYIGILHIRVSIECAPILTTHSILHMPY